MNLSQRAVSCDFAPGRILHRLQIPLYPDDLCSLGQNADFWKQQFLPEFPACGPLVPSVASDKPMPPGV